MAPKPDGRHWVGEKGFTDPYNGGKPCARLHKHGHTFRWCRGDHWIGVQRGTVVDSHRQYIIRDTLAGRSVINRPTPVIDVIEVCADWNDPHALHRVADAWAAAHPPARHSP